MGLRSRSRNPAGGLDLEIVFLNEKCAHGLDDLSPEPKVFFYVRLSAVFHIDIQDKGLYFSRNVKISIPLPSPPEKGDKRMQWLTHNQTKFKIIAVLALLAFVSTGFASGLSVGRIIPKGKVTLFQGNQKVGEFGSEAPFPEGAFLSVQGECGVKMSNLYLVAIDKSLFSVTTDPDSRNLSVKTGTVYFALSSMPHILVFKTPDGVITAHQALLNASAKSGLLQGYVSVTDAVTKVGVLEGGSLLLSAGDGETRRINTGQELRLAQAGLFDTKEEKKQEPKDKKDKPKDKVKDKGWSTRKKVLVGVATVAAIGGIAAAAGGGGGGGGGGGSSSPAE